MKVYLSGKITDKDHDKQKKNIEKFTKAKSFVYFKYFPSKIYSPPELVAKLKHKWYWQCMAIDLYYLIFKSDSIYLLDNWKDSKGAKIELFFALLTRKRVL